MCWSFIASGIFAAIGIAAAVYFAWKKESKLIWIPLAYFALMEALQAATYFYLGQCFAPENQMLTLFFILAYRVPAPIHKCSRHVFHTSSRKKEDILAYYCPRRNIHFDNADKAVSFAMGRNMRYRDNFMR